MNLLFLHGLESKLHEAKRVRLQKYGKIFEPNIDYYYISNAIEWVLEKYGDLNFETLIGSMGGFADYISNRISIPALLFNPALRSHSTFQQVPELNPFASAFKQMVIGHRPCYKSSQFFNFFWKALRPKNLILSGFKI